jgi:hypothetical protein
MKKDEPRYSASWWDGNTECGVFADASGVDVSSKWGPGPYEESGRTYTWEEWAESPGIGLSPGGPADLMTRIHEVAVALGKPFAAAPPPEIHRRADLETEELSAEEQRRIRLRRALGPG